MNYEVRAKRKENLSVSIVIPTYNRCELLLRQLNSLFLQDLASPLYEIIVVNDGSTDGTSEAIQALYTAHPNLRLVDRTNCGPGGARNAGARFSRASILAFTDDDCLATPDWLTAILSPFQNPKVVAVQGRTTTDPSKKTPLTHEIQVFALSSALPTCNVAYRKQVFWDAGGFDINFRYAHNEDTDLAWRIESFGTVVFAPDAKIDHPPRLDPLPKHLNWGRHLESEFALFRKHPKIYSERRFCSPWLTIYWRMLFIGQLFQFKSSFRYLFWHFNLKYFFLAQFLLAARWINIIRFFPFYRQASKYYSRLFETESTRQRID